MSEADEEEGGGEDYEDVGDKAEKKQVTAELLPQPEKKARYRFFFSVKKNFVLLITFPKR